MDSITIEEGILDEFGEFVAHEFGKTIPVGANLKVIDINADYHDSGLGLVLVVRLPGGGVKSLELRDNFFERGDLESPEDMVDRLAQYSGMSRKEVTRRLRKIGALPHPEGGVSEG